MIHFSTPWKENIETKQGMYKENHETFTQYIIDVD